MQYVREELSQLPYLAAAFGVLGSGLAAGCSRTVYGLPMNQLIRDNIDAMVGVARMASERIYDEGLDTIDPRRVPLDLRADDSPEQFETATLPDGVKASMSTDPIGYIRVEKTETGQRASVGALDPKTYTHYSIPLS